MIAEILVDFRDDNVGPDHDGGSRIKHPPGNRSGVNLSKGVPGLQEAEKQSNNDYRAQACQTAFTRKPIPCAPQNQ
ncbi:MAG TPA: hypothetical protein VI320_26675 [Terracidiphilus sp.]